MTVYLTGGCATYSPQNIVRYPVDFLGKIEYLPFYKAFDED